MFWITLVFLLNIGTTSMNKIHIQYIEYVILHCKDTVPKFKTNTVLPEMKLRGLFPNFHIHVFVSDLFIPRVCLPS
jgi:hypothetical protein